MKLLWLIGVLAWMATGTAAHAFSPVIEIFPERPPRWAEAIDISSERLANGDIQFTVAITSSSNFGTSLGAVKVTPSSVSNHHLRSLPAERNGSVLKCVFSVTKKELEDPDLAFRLITGGNPGGWNFTTYFVHLGKFLKP